MGLDFDPNSILSNTSDKVHQLIEDVVEPPVEDVLMSKTLWPEQQKLYGHAFEVFCIATSHKGDCAASASKAKEKKYADIIIWELSKGQQTSVPSCKLIAHNLTVVQLEFSKCDQYLLSCSRDRSWALFKRNDPTTLQFTLLKKLKDAHTRIIWGINWSHDDAFFATASREKQKSIKVWNGLTEGATIGELHSELPEENPSATAIRFFPGLHMNTSYGLVVGLESGDLLFWLLNSETKTWSKIYQVPTFYTHCGAVRRIKFNERYGDHQEKGEYVVASCANDHSVRLFKVKL